MRLDEALVRRGLAPSRSRARDAILRGTVRLGAAVCRKPAAHVGEGDALEVDDPAGAYVSRAALKLIAGLDAFGLDPAGARALDIGASTGGFTQVLLERGAASVTAVDVGHGQMAGALLADPRVTLHEGLNARDVTLAHCGGERPEFLVCDVSFISLTLALPPALEIAAPQAAAVLLVKPQFEVGREGIGKGGLLRDAQDGPRTAERLATWLDARPGWRSLGLHPSPVEGGDGNREWLLGGRKDR